MPLRQALAEQKSRSACPSLTRARHIGRNRSLWRMAAGSIFALAGLLTLPMLLWAPPPFSVNVSESLPVGLYWTRSFHQRSRDVDNAPSADQGRHLGVEVGMLVSACLPPKVATSAVERGYLPEGSCPSGVAPVGKIIAALPGDTVEVTDSGSFVNGSPLPESAPLLSDSKGRAMPQLRGRFVLPAGTAWLYSGHSPRSFDSRYYGPVPLSGIRGQLFPLLTRGKAHRPSFWPMPRRSGGPRAQGKP